MAPDSPSMTLTIPSDLRFLTVARSFVESVCQAGGIDAHTTSAVVLATHEAVSNVMRHAQCAGAPLELRCRLLADGIEVCLLDEGEPFDLDAVPYFNPAEVRVGGRGVFLMRTLLDELSCQSRGRKGNVLRMVKHGPRPRRECG